MPKFSKEKSKICNVINDKIDEESLSDQENNVVTFTTHIKNTRGVKYICVPSNSNNICVTPIQKKKITISSNKSQHHVKHIY